MSSVIEAILFYRVLSTGTISDIDIHNIVVSYIDDALYSKLLERIRDPEAREIFEAFYLMMSLHDVITWLRGGEIGIDSIPSYIVAMVYEWAKRFLRSG
ncbi:MAG: hypothetical protein GXO32_05195 [Crenarchaeota archaeon]|nr:hypothetical protein [Thermoproteota archaeon]